MTDLGGAKTLICQGRSFVIPQISPMGEQLHFFWIEAGAFVMGSPESEVGRSETERQFLAKLSRGFWLSKHLVTQAQWEAVMQYNPSKYQLNGANRPVENVSWIDAMEFCQRLMMVPHISLPDGFTFSLPTQAQWEYACRAGTTTRYFFGESDAELDRFAWYSENSLGETHPVGLKEPNPWGFHDMYGNVWEWCFDGAAEYPLGDATDWIGPLNTQNRVVRGGSWGTPVKSGDFRSACRSYSEPHTKRPWDGFRVSLREIRT
jgi:formylglycine-generating enzyme required for sulfatase activity